MSVARETQSEANATAFVLEAKAIDKSFGATHVLRGANLRIRRGEIHALLGGNGAGKSTLIRIISGSHRHDSGSIRIDGREDPDGNAIAVVFQELALLPHLSVAENITLPHRKRALARLSEAECFEEARAALALVDQELAERALDWSVAQLDLHERQFVEIARALSSGARVLLLDEPTANLTFSETERLFGILRRLAQQGISTLLVSHRMGEIRALADVCTVLRDGRSVLDRAALSEISDEAIVEAMGQKSSALPPAAPRSAVAASARTQIALRGPGVSLSIASGEVLGLAGAPAGPSGVIETLIGARRSEAWRVTIDGVDVTFASPADAVRAGVGYVSGDRAEKGILATLPILDNIVAAARVAGRRILASSGEATAAQAALDRLSIKASSIDALPQTVSGGTQQKLLLARWLAPAPKILVLEEPTRGVDIGTKREIYAMIRDAAAAGCVVVWWSTEFTELIAVCDRVIAFDLGGQVSGILGRDEVDEVSLSRATGMAA
ncbi:sugar ABC transporter ATP-binding protein [Bradyrhizobium sp. USDA 4353]